MHLINLPWRTNLPKRCINLLLTNINHQCTQTESKTCLHSQSMQHPNNRCAATQPAMMSTAETHMPPDSTSPTPPSLPTSTSGRNTARETIPWRFATPVARRSTARAKARDPDAQTQTARHFAKLSTPQRAVKKSQTLTVRARGCGGRHSWA